MKWYRRGRYQCRRLRLRKYVPEIA